MASSGSVAAAQTISPLDPTFQLLGGGAEGSLGETLSWILVVVACVAIICLLVYSRRQRRKFGFPLRPMWAEVLLGVVGCWRVLGGPARRQRYLWPEGLATGAPRTTASRPPAAIQVGHPLPDRHPASASPS